MVKGSLVCCIPWGRKELDTTERLNLTELILSCAFQTFYCKFILIYNQKTSTINFYSFYSQKNKLDKEKRSVLVLTLVIIRLRASQPPSL